MNKKKEKIYREVSSERNPRSRAKRVRMLLKKNSEVFKDKQKLTDFKEPVLMMIRRSGSVEFYEDASKGEFQFKHSDGNDRIIYLDPSGQLTFDYGKRKFKGYICQEDTPMPLPENPKVAVDGINGIVEKVGLDMKKLNLRGKELQLKTMKTLMWFGLGALLLLILWKTHAFDKIIGMITGNKWVDPSTITNVVTNTAQNSSNVVRDNSLNILSGVTGN